MEALGRSCLAIGHESQARVVKRAGHESRSAPPPKPTRADPRHRPEAPIGATRGSEQQRDAPAAQGAHMVRPGARQVGAGPCRECPHGASRVGHPTEHELLLSLQG